MDINLPGVELVTKSDVLGLASWDQPRSTDHLLGFIARREAALADVDEDM